MPGATKKASAARRGRWLADRRVNTKVLLAVGVVTAPAASIGVLSLVRMAGIAAAAHHMYTENVMSTVDPATAREMAVKTRFDVNPAYTPQAYRQIRDEKLLPLARTGSLAELQRVRNAAAIPLNQQAQGLLTSMVQAESAQAKESEVGAAARLDESAHLSEGALLVLGLAATLALALYLARLIVTLRGRSRRCSATPRRQT